ncbi:MAG: hypothetical protein H5U20_04070 [Rhodobacteraceae bacterium]|nr:hypothetical protein [Paracoccaceae bacterium]
MALAVTFTGTLVGTDNTPLGGAELTVTAGRTPTASGDDVAITTRRSWTTDAQGALPGDVTIIVGVHALEIAHASLPMPIRASVTVDLAQGATQDIRNLFDVPVIPAGSQVLAEVLAARDATVISADAAAAAATDAAASVYDEFALTGAAGSVLVVNAAETAMEAPNALTRGYAQTSFDAGTISTGTFTPDEANGAMQRYVNGGAHSLAPPVNDTSIHIQMTNAATAGAVTVSGFTVVTGDILTTAAGDDFFLVIAKNNGFSHLHVVALQ